MTLLATPALADESLTATRPARKAVVHSGAVDRAVASPPATSPVAAWDEDEDDEDDDFGIYDDDEDDLDDEDDDFYDDEEFADDEDDEEDYEDGDDM